MKLTKRRKLKTNGHLKLKPTPLFWKILTNEVDSSSWIATTSYVDKINKNSLYGKFGTQWPHVK